MRAEIRAGDVLVGGFVKDGFDIEGVDFLFLEEFLFIEIVLLGIQFLTGRHYEKFEEENEGVLARTDAAEHEQTVF